MTEEVRTKRLVIEGDDGKVVATLEASQGGAGLWIKAPDGTLIAIYGIDGQAAIGMYAPGYKAGPMDLAFSVDRKGDAYVQFNDGGETKVVELASVAEHVRHCGRGPACCEVARP